MLLVIDIGNSNIVVSLWDGSDWSPQYRIESRIEQPQVFYENQLINMMLEWGIQGQEIRECVISSVVPDLNKKLLNTIFNLYGIEGFIITPEVIINLPMHIPHPYIIGSDLVANAYAASKIYSKNALIVDFGTALTFTVIEDQTGLSGVTIMPGIKTALHSLFTNTAQLPEVSLDIPSSAIGNDTVTAIQAGVLWGYVGAVKEIISKIKDEKGDKMTVIATGGLSKILNPLESYFNFVDRDLTLKGIRLIFEQSNKINTSDE
jgi:type III pantothenate kinase